MNGEFRENYINNCDCKAYTSIYNEGYLVCGVDASAWSEDIGIFTNGMYKNVLTVNRVNVHPKLRGKGIAKFLMNKLCEFADREGITLELGVSSDMSSGSLDYYSLIKFYEKFGFRLIADLPSIMVREFK